MLSGPCPPRTGHNSIEEIGNHTPEISEIIASKVKKQLQKGMKKSEPGVVTHACNPSTREAEAGGSVRVRDQPGLQSEFKASLSCIGRRCLKKTKKKQLRLAIQLSGLKHLLRQA